MSEAEREALGSDDDEEKEDAAPVEQVEEQLQMPPIKRDRRRRPSQDSDTDFRDDSESEEEVDELQAEAMMGEASALAGSIAPSTELSGLAASSSLPAHPRPHKIQKGRFDTPQ